MSKATNPLGHDLNPSDHKYNSTQMRKQEVSLLIQMYEKQKLSSPTDLTYVGMQLPKLFYEILISFSGKYVLSLLFSMEQTYSGSELAFLRW